MRTAIKAPTPYLVNPDSQMWHIADEFTVRYQTKRSLCGVYKATEIASECPPAEAIKCNKCHLLARQPLHGC